MRKLQDFNGEKVLLSEFENGLFWLGCYVLENSKYSGKLYSAFWILKFPYNPFVLKDKAMS